MVLFGSISIAAFSYDTSMIGIGPEISESIKAIYTAAQVQQSSFRYHGFASNDFLGAYPMGGSQRHAYT